MRSLAIAVALTLSVPVAHAQTAPIIAYPPQNDTVSMSLALEDWVQTQTARTELAIDAAMPGSDAGKVRGDMLSAVKSLAQNAEWRFTRFDRDQDSSGLEHWHAVLEARLPETQLGGLSDRAKQASRPGLQVRVQNVDFSPTLAEIEATKAKLRGDLYKRVNDALSQLNQAEPDRKYRIQNINFGYQPIAPVPQYMNMMAKAASAAAPMQDGGGIEMSQKIQVNANVTFATHAPRD